VFIKSLSKSQRNALRLLLLKSNTETLQHTLNSLAKKNNDAVTERHKRARSAERDGTVFSFGRPRVIRRFEMQGGEK
jgi:hypothetical protein